LVKLKACVSSEPVWLPPLIRSLRVCRSVKFSPDWLNVLVREVVEVSAYRTVTADAQSPGVDEVKTGDFDVVTFTSGSSVRGFVALVGEPKDLGLAEKDPVGKITACIGPRTAAEAQAAGFRVDVVAEEQTVAGLVSALLAWDH
jgi:uroporphyrinogen-III synthase